MTNFFSEVKSEKRTLVSATRTLVGRKNAFDTISNIFNKFTWLYLFKKLCCIIRIPNIVDRLSKYVFRIDMNYETTHVSI